MPATHFRSSDEAANELIQRWRQPARDRVLSAAELELARSLHCSFVRRSSKFDFAFYCRKKLNRKTGVAVENPHRMVDIHCHLLPGIDDGAKSWSESLAMARMAVADGTGLIIATPHQLGSFGHNDADDIRSRVAEMQRLLDEEGIRLTVLPGADVRIEPAMTAGLKSGEVLTLGDRKKHVLLELPHELYFPLETVLDQLHAMGLAGILSHPERNQGLLKQPSLIEPLVLSGCLMQITAGSLLGTFGPACQQLSEWMLQRQLVHFVATDAHGAKSRRPLLGRAEARVADLVDEETAQRLCRFNPAAVAAGSDVAIPSPRDLRPRGLAAWFPWRKAG